MTARRPGSDRLAAVAGSIAAAVALGVSELVAGLLPGASSFVAAVGQQVIDRQPAGAKDLVVALFGTNDKLALEAIVALAVLAFGAALGVVARRRLSIALIGIAALGVVGFLSALGDPLANPALVAVQAALTVAIGAQVLQGGLDRLQRMDAAARHDVEAADPRRRAFLWRAGALGVAAAVGGLGGRLLIDRGRTPPSNAPADLPGPIQPAAPLPAGVDLAAETADLTSIVVPNDAFYRIDTALITPTVDIATWSLRVHGLVDREVTLTWDQLVAMPVFEQYVTIACVSNEVGGRLVGNAKWTGVRLRDVLELAGVHSAATQLVGRSVDGWTAGMPTAWVQDEAREPMIAVRMNDEPLPPNHGYPARLIVPGLYGYVSATKWLSELELTTWEGFDAYWVPLGWSKEGPILTQSRIDTPQRTATPGRVAIAGVAWAPDRGIAKVEVGIDGAWFEADLSTPISDATWVQWRAYWDAAPGDHVLQVRATDGHGEVQEERSTPPAPDGARGYHTVTIAVG